jgi:DNA-binding transcriptional ArsR family regulator
MPSIFAPEPTATVNEGDDEPAVVTFPVRADWYPTPERSSLDRSPLADLLGSTRAAVVEALADRAATTGGLARRLGISAATASEHASVLRAANLVTSERDGNRVVHRLTPLGLALSGGPAGRPPAG